MGQHRKIERGSWAEERHEWTIHVGFGPRSGNCIAIVHMGGRGATVNSEEAVKANAELIVRAVNRLPLLTAEVKALRAEVRRLKKGLVG
jgi:hypothetical protein